MTEFKHELAVPCTPDTELGLDEQARMVQALRTALAAEQRSEVLLIETHISFQSVAQVSRPLNCYR
jgi:hypothetical protein